MNLINIQNIVFWDPSYSPHKVSFVNALARQMNDVNIMVFADQCISPERRALGWDGFNNSLIPWEIDPDKSTIEKVIFLNPENTLHIFSGLRRVPLITYAIKCVKKSNSRFAIMHEPRVREGWKGELRYVQSWITEGWFRKNSEFILAIGKNGPKWFESVGYPKSKIFPFAYFIDAPNYQFPIKGSGKNLNKINVGYVGRIVEAKGIFDLAQAVALLGENVTLTIVGVGPDEKAFRQRCVSLNINIEFVGSIPITKISETMNEFDVLVLASNTKDDGWGVVVSEALMAGTAVIATPEVGASLMLDEALFGLCVPAHSPESISAAVMKLKADGAYQISQRKLRSKLAKKRLSSTAGAHFLKKIIEWSSKNGEYPVPFHQYKSDAV